MFAGRVPSVGTSYAVLGALSIAVTFSGVGLAAADAASSGHRHHVSASALQSTAAAPSPAAPDSSTPASPAPVVKRLPAHKPWPRLLLAVPHHWVHPHDIKLPVRRLAKLFVHPRTVGHDLAALGYRRGVERDVYRPSPRVTVGEQAWQFRTADGALGWYDLWRASNEPHPHSLLRSAFRIAGVPGARGYLCRTRDHYGFSCGLAIARAGDLVLRIRFASLSPVTKPQITRWLRVAAKQAGLHASGAASSSTTTLPA
ncbi:MAG: hypothetical protein JO222_01325 [Frankiales bacterium]|nr:hypothetical protein [Frankiales bacterium]